MKACRPHPVGRASLQSLYGRGFLKAPLTLENAEFPAAGKAWWAEITSAANFPASGGKFPAAVLSPLLQHIR